MATEENDYIQPNKDTSTTSIERMTHGFRERESPNVYLVICSISKRPNVRSLLTVAAAFGCDAVFMVGQKKFDCDPAGRDIPGSIRHHLEKGGLPVQRFDKWDEFVAYIAKERIRLLGVEIHSEARPIEAYFDKKDTAYLMGNEGQGLSDKQMKACHGFVQIPQYGAGTASLNVYVAASVVLQRVYQWKNC